METMRFVGMELFDMSSLGYSYQEKQEAEAKDDEQEDKE